MESMFYLYSFAFFALLVILISLQSAKQARCLGHEHFKALVFLTMMMIVIDFFHEYINGLEGVYSRFALYFLSFSIYTIPVIIAYIWFNYVHLLVYYRKPRKGIGLLLLQMPVLISFLLSFLSFFYPIYFVISPENVYSRGNIFLLSIVLQLVYIIIAIVMVIANKKNLRNEKFYPLAFFAIPPMIGTLIQSFNYGLLLVWPTIAFSIYIIYIFIQSKITSTDFLTGLMNKGAFENYIINIKTNKKEKKLSALMMDLDGLKATNDKFGHQIGDEVLSEFARITVNVFNSRDYIARIGGDEFVVLTYINNQDELEYKIENLKKSVKDFNSLKILPADIEFSYGFDFYIPEKDTTIKQLLERVDQLMYQNKELKR